MDPSLWLVVILHQCIAMLCLLKFGGPAIWLVSNLLFSLGLYLWLASHDSPVSRTVCGLLSGLWMLAGVLLGVAYYTQGQGFSDAFFYHLDAASALVALRAYPLPSAGVLLLLVLALAWPWLVRPRPMASPVAGVLATVGLALALLSCAPAHSLLDYREQAVAPDRLIEPKPAAPVSTESGPGQPPGPGAKADARPKNILLIYAESLEGTYFNQSVFGDLLPELSRLAVEAQNFTGLKQVSKTEWTIAGIVASQCGFPLVVNHLLSNTSLASISEPFADQQCLGDVLAQRGYRTVFMGGADHAFGGKGNFLRTHGYQQVLGLEELRPGLSDPEYVNSWGLFDDSLFELAGQQLRELERGEQPWMLTLLTVDTHFPRGHASQSCRPLPVEATSIEHAIYCSDQLISRFIREAMQELDMTETIIVLFSDHLTMRNELWPKLAPIKDQRTLMFMVFNDQPGAVQDTPGSHFDVAPTLLELARVDSPAPLGMGISLLGEAALARRSVPSYNHRSVSKPLGDNPSVLGAGLTFGAADMSLNIGDLKLLANDDGRPFEEGMFLLAFNQHGQVAEIIYSNNFSELLENHPNRTVAGVSLFKGDPGPLSFYGRLSGDPADIVQQPLLNDIRVEPDVFSGWLGKPRQNP